MLLANVSFDKENNPCINQKDADHKNEEFVRITTQKLRSIIKKHKPDEMSPGTLNATSQNDVSAPRKLQRKIRLGLLPNDETQVLKYLPRSPVDQMKPVKDKNLLRRLKHVSFDSSPPQTLNASDVTCDVEARAQNGDRRCAKRTENNRNASEGHSGSNDESQTSEPESLVREGTFTLSDSSEKSESDDSSSVGKDSVAKSNASHCSTCTCGQKSPESPSEKHLKIDIGDLSPKSRNSRDLKTRIPIVVEKRRKGRERKESRDRNEKTRDVRETKSAGVLEKKSCLKRTNGHCAWEKTSETRAAESRVTPFRDFVDSKIQFVTKGQAESYAMLRRRGATSPSDPCPSCSQIHGDDGPQVDGEGERLPNPAEILLKIKRKHLRKRILSDSVTAYTKECQTRDVDVTSSHVPNSCNAHALDSRRRCMTDETHLEKLKENVTLSLKRCTLTSANARMLTEGDPPFCSTPIPQKTSSPVKPENRDSKNRGKDSPEVVLNRTFSISDCEEFSEIHKPKVDSESSATPNAHASKANKPLLSRRQLAMAFEKFENEIPAFPDVEHDVSPQIGNLDTSMMNTVNEIPKCNRLPPIPQGRKVTGKVTATPRSKKRQKNLVGLDLKGVSRMEDLPPIVRDELKTKARMRLKQLTSPLPESGRNH